MSKDTETVKLYSLTGAFPTKEVTLTKLSKEDLSDISRYCEGSVFLAQKMAKVNARPAKLGEIVDSRPRVLYEGVIYTFSETKQTIRTKHVKSGAMIVTNPDGEEIVISSKGKFVRKYTPVQGGYIAIDGAKHFVRSNGNYAIETSWGKRQYVLKGSYFCIENMDDIYGVTEPAFEATYKIVEDSLSHTERNKQIE